VLCKDDIHFVKEKIAPHSSSILSLYVDVNPSNPDNASRAWLIRAKDTIKSLQIPRDIADKAIETLEFDRPDARVYALFVAQDLVRIYVLQVDPPVVDLAHGRVEARWGEPYVFPLEYVLDEYERYGVVFVDKVKWRLYEVFLGDIEERTDAFLELGSRGQSRKLEKRPAARVTPGVELRGGAEGDQYARHIDAVVHRFYKRAAHLLAKAVETSHIDRLILMGPHEDTHFFEQFLSHALRLRMAGHIPSLPNPQASAGEVLKRVTPFVAESRQAYELALLQELRDRGMWGPRILQVLQMGRLYLLAAPWNLNAKVLRCARGLVVEDQQAAEAFCPGQIAQEVALRDVIVDLATAHGARLEFMQGQAEARLLKEFGGLAGFPRW
jgi:peptide subunit release factor 1 (eRF1)